MAGRTPKRFNYEVSHENLWNYLSNNSEIRDLAAKGEISKINQYLKKELQLALTDSTHPLNHAMIQDKGFFKVNKVGGKDIANVLQKEQYNRMLEEGVDGIKAMLNNPQGLDLLSKGAIVDTVGTSGGKSDLLYRIGDETVLKQSLKKGQAVLFSSEKAFSESLLESLKKTVKNPEQLNQGLEELNTFISQLAGTKGQSRLEQKLVLPEYQRQLDEIFKKYPGLDRALNLREVGDVDNVLYIGGRNSKVLNPEEAINYIKKIRLRTAKGMSGGRTRSITGVADIFQKPPDIDLSHIWQFNASPTAQAIFADSFYGNQKILGNLSQDLVNIDKTISDSLKKAIAKEKIFSLGDSVLPTGGYNRLGRRVVGGYTAGLPFAYALDPKFREKVHGIDFTNPKTFSETVAPAAEHALVDYAIGETIFQGGKALLPNAVKTVLSKGAKYATGSLLAPLVKPAIVASAAILATPTPTADGTLDAHRDPQGRLPGDPDYYKKEEINEEETN